MATLVIAMLFISIGMVSTVSEMRTWLIDLHKPLGILILCLAALRASCGSPAARRRCPTICRSGRRQQPCLAPRALRLMFALPLVGWTMLSAGGYPIACSVRSICRRLARSIRCCSRFLRRAHTLLVSCSS